MNTKQTKAKAQVKALLILLDLFFISVVLIIFLSNMISDKSLIELIDRESITSVELSNYRLIAVLFMLPALLGRIVPCFISSRSDIANHGLATISWLSVITITFFWCAEIYLRHYGELSEISHTALSVLPPLIIVILMFFIGTAVAGMLIPKTSTIDHIKSKYWKNVIRFSSSGLRSDEKREPRLFEPFIRLLVFISLFLSITYLFGFAIAFHDMRLRNDTINSVGVYLNPISVPRAEGDYPEILSENNELANLLSELEPLSILEPEKIKKRLLKYLINNESRREDDLLALSPDSNGHPLRVHATAIFKSIRAYRIEYGDIPVRPLAHVIRHALTYKRDHELDYKSELKQAIEVFSNNNDIKLSELESNVIESILDLYITVNYSAKFNFDSGRSDLGEKQKTHLNEGYKARAEKVLKELSMTFEVTGSASQDSSTLERNEIVAINRIKAILEELKCNHGKIKPFWKCSTKQQIEPYNIGIEASHYQFAEVVASVEWKDVMSEYLLGNKSYRHKPNLLEYMYFSIYTMTTTGYGDILPVSSYVKLITSLENIIELIFTVIFFGVFLYSITQPPVVPNGVNTGNEHSRESDKEIEHW